MTSEPARMPESRIYVRRTGERRQIERRLINDPCAYSADRRASERRSGIDRRMVRNHDLV